MSVQGSLGSLLRGVSQQTASARLEGQVEEQVNMVSDVDTGLASRTGTSEVAKLLGATSTMAFHNIRFGDTDYVFGYEAGSLVIWDEAGTVYPLTWEDVAAQAYMTTNMRFHVYKDQIFCLNRDTVVEADVSNLGYSHHVAMVSALGGNYSRDYKVTVTHSGGSFTGTYTTPDGNNAGDSEKTASTYIIDQIRADIQAQLDALTLTLPAGMTMGVAEDVLLFKYTESMSIAIDDGEAGAILKTLSDQVDDTADLPRFAPHNTVVKVVGDVADEDDYFLRFTSSTTTVDGDGFGDEGVWEEWFDPTLPTDFVKSTMPHVLTFDGTTFAFARGDWQSRRVGDEDSNPMPSFVGHKVRDVGGFESRLVFVTNIGTCVMSRTKYPLDFFKKSATTLIDSDPIDITSTKEGSLTLDWIIPFDQNLLLLSDPGDSQFIITGGGLTPSNASMSLTTSYEMFGLARPVTTGRTLLFPFRAGDYAGVNEFFTSDKLTTGGAENVTEVQRKYILGQVTDMASSKNFNTVLFRASGAATTVWVYKYLWEGVERLQASWGKWEFQHTVRKVFFLNSNVYFVLEDAQGHWLVKGDMNKSPEANQDYHVTLDRKTYQTVADNKVTVNFADARFVQDTGCINVGRETTPEASEDNGDGTWTYTLSESAPNGATVVSGQGIEAFVDPTMPIVKDREDRPISSAEVTIMQFSIHLAKSGDVSTVFTSPFRETFEFEQRRFPLDDEPMDPSLSLVADYILDVPWGERSDWSQLRIKSTNVRPVTITEVEYTAQVTGVKRRI